MADAGELVAAARTWLGTPVAHFGRAPAGVAKGVGVDCLNLVLGATLELELVDLAGEVFTYGRLPNPTRLVATLDRFLVPVRPIIEMREADVLALSWNSRGLAMHLAILASQGGQPTIIHADPSAKPPRVVETGFRGLWASRLCGVWRIPALL